MNFLPHHIAISVSNMSRSIDFYADFGFVEYTNSRSKNGNYNICHLVLNGFILELFCFDESYPLPESSLSIDTDLQHIGVKHFAMKVGSLDEAKTTFIQKGLMKEIEIRESIFGFKYFFIQDPDGILVEIIEDNRIF